MGRPKPSRGCGAFGEREREKPPVPPTVMFAKLLDNGLLRHRQINKISSASFNERQSFAVLRVICAIGQWEKPTRQPCSLILINRNQSLKLEIMVLE
jgi:hypothetical protein